MERSIPESGGPLASRQRQGRPSVTIAAQQDSVVTRRMFCCILPLLPRVAWVEVVAGPLAVQ
uniref:Uncharacterized protein n=1 Tax=Brassica oleracea TaxID=3712 RepID=A0A3P6C899_BRAOL|nr:unnamed protein product [Brassica oleracea]